MDHDYPAHRCLLARPTRRFLLVLSIMALASGPALAQGEPKDVVEQFHAKLIEIMREAKDLGAQGRFDRLRPTMEATFDLPAMTRIAIGPPWSKMARDQQAALTQAFSEWSIATYANRFNGYSGETFTTVGETVLRSGDHLVRTTLDRTDGEPVQLNYLLRQGTGGDWRIVDVYLTGTISELASRRSEFATVLAEGGPERLTAELRRRTADLLQG